ncbi:hypothetical protein P3W85_29750 [Cupriavidus basilensis]|uniref:Uncharacterized protein n=1 Tax=Cupriavidus basilensis TaxID=68895 RepID=A0ABT6AWV9_9BURK|nr:hypothetical protein [Cupriavidus basilensis]MDF3837107.1 hypothetical protein [Cupriavidus basilensis]
MNIEEIKRQAKRAVRRGDVAKMDQLEIAYMKEAVPLTKAGDDEWDRVRVVAQPVRLFRGAGPNNETRVQWVRFDGVHVMSDINGYLLDDEPCQPTLLPMAEAA